MTLFAIVSQVEVPESWAPIVKPDFHNTDRTIQLTYYETQLVSTGSHRDEQLGPWPFPEKRGELSKALLQAVQFSEQELWPDWESEFISDQVHSTCSVIAATSAMCSVEMAIGEIHVGILLRTGTLRQHCSCRRHASAVNLSSLRQDGSWEHGTKMETKDIGILTGLMWCQRTCAEWAASTNMGRN
jgi:hypothetical protein